MASVQPIVVTLLALLSALGCARSAGTNRPIIGILSAPDGAETTFGKEKAQGFPGKYYIAASYIKFVESAGAQAVPIRFDMDDTQVKFLHKRLNGFLFPGGDVNVGAGSPYRHITGLIYNLTLQAAAEGRHVPLWGTCLGCEELAILGSGRASILSGFNSGDITLPVTFAPACSASKSPCKLFGKDNTPADVLSGFENTTVPNAFNNHHAGVGVSDFVNDARLSKNFIITSTSKDRDGKVFVNSFEHNTAPIFAVQFHPEKALFEWNHRESIPHSAQATISNGYLARFLIDEARKNSNSFDSTAQEQLYVIYNWNPTFTGKTANELNDFEQCYFFN